MNDIDKFVEYIIDNNTSFQDIDRIYLINRIKGLIGDVTDSDSHTNNILNLNDALVQTAIENGKIKDDLNAKQNLSDYLMDLATPLPSTVNETFWNLYQRRPSKATNYFFRLCQRNNYIKTRSIANNINFKAPSKYGELEININFLKPEVEPKMLMHTQKKFNNGYPKCPLCIENEGYTGQVGLFTKANLRIIRMQLSGETWCFQFSPFQYFNEHVIFTPAIHKPMEMNQRTFANLLSIVEDFPEYFVGSNAGLPIVGGTITAHMHYQGGRHHFPMMSAKIMQNLDLNIPDVKIGRVDWPTTTLRIQSDDPRKIVPVATKIFNFWKNYSDESVDLRAYTNETQHHTVTPIAYQNEGDYFLDLVLRDNQTSTKYPDGIFHPHKDVQHIKKEGIGLIEVMGRAVLPGRLGGELKEVEKYVLNKPNQIANYHRAWADQIKENNNCTTENIQQVIQNELGNVFARILEDSGVFKRNSTGDEAFERFTTKLKEE